MAGSTLTFGSNYSDPAVKSAFASLTDSAAASAKAKIKINTADHNTFQQNITSYLQGAPDDLFTWFAGYRMQYFAAQGLAEPIDDVREKIGGNFIDVARTLSTGLDSRHYLVPLYNYPWVVFYSRSLFKKNGYTVPTTWDEYLALCKKMKSDGLIPIAFGDKDGWPALGAFDILNLRINGYNYHVKLMKHEVPWTDQGVYNVFQHWSEMMPYMQSGANGRIWQDAVKTLESKKAGMMFQGTRLLLGHHTHVVRRQTTGDLGAGQPAGTVREQPEPDHGRRDDRRDPHPGGVRAAAEAVHRRAVPRVEQGVIRSGSHLS